MTNFLSPQWPWIFVNISSMNWLVLPNSLSNCIKELAIPAMRFWATYCQRESRRHIQLSPLKRCKMALIQVPPLKHCPASKTMMNLPACLTTACSIPKYCFNSTPIDFWASSNSESRTNYPPIIKVNIDSSCPEMLSIVDKSNLTEDQVQIDPCLMWIDLMGYEGQLKLCLRNFGLI